MNKVFSQQSRKRSIKRRRYNGLKQRRVVLMKRRAAGETSLRPINGVERRIRTLQKLVPNGKSMGLNGLFRETQQYILRLEMKIKVMQIMVNLLPKSDE